MKSVLILDNLRSVYNVGSIFRTANAVGISHIILCGITPTPLDKRGNKRSDFAKVALGAEETVSWEYKEDVLQTVVDLKKGGCYIIAIEQDERSVDYKNVDITSKEQVAFIIGPEVTGMSKELLTFCDVVAEIPMKGTKESLNVTIALGVALYRILGL